MIVRQQFILFFQQKILKIKLHCKYSEMTLYIMWKLESTFERSKATELIKYLDLCQKVEIKSLLPSVHAVYGIECVLNFYINCSQFLHYFLKQACVPFTHLHVKTLCTATCTVPVYKINGLNTGDAKVVGLNPAIALTSLSKAFYLHVHRFSPPRCYKGTWKNK